MNQYLVYDQGRDRGGGHEGKGGLIFLVGGQNWREHPTGGWSPVPEY